MKVLICLLATVTACNATFLSGNGGGRTVTYNVVPKPIQGHGHSNSLGHGHVESHGHGHEHNHGHNHDHVHVESHDHGHEHNHGHNHDHIHVENHGHGHDHSHDHNHDHIYVETLGHGHEHSQDHSHIQIDDHSHDHSHGFSHHGNSHSYEVAPQVITVFVEEGRGYSGGDDIHSYGNSYGASYASAPQEAIYQVIHESAAISHGYSDGDHAEYAVLDDGHSYGSDHAYASHGSHGSHGSGGDSAQLNSILPQILQIIEQDGAFGSGGGFGSGGSYGGNGHYAQLLNAYGHHGTATVSRSKKGSKNTFYSSGHVIDQGVLEMSQGKKKAGVGGGGFGGLSGLLSRLTGSNGDSGGHGSSEHHPVSSSWSYA